MNCVSITRLNSFSFVHHRRVLLDVAVIASLLFERTMASQRLILASPLRRRGISSWRTPQVFSCISSDHFKHQREQHQLPPTTTLTLSNYTSIRSFSASFEKESYRTRAKHASQHARERMSANAAKTSKAARKGAKTAKEMLQQYGPVFVGTYMSIYFLTWGTLFVGMDSGLLDPVAILGWIGGNAQEGKSTVHVVVEILEKYSWTAPYAETVEKNPHFANLAVAWITTKFTEPLRLAVTLGIVPKLARHFGFVHVVAPQEEGGSVSAVEEKDEKDSVDISKEKKESKTKAS